MTEPWRYRRHKLSGKIHHYGGCRYTHGRWTQPWPEMDGKNPHEVIDHLEDEHSLAPNLFCHLCFEHSGFYPNIEISNRLALRKIRVVKEALRKQFG